MLETEGEHAGSIDVLVAGLESFCDSIFLGVFILPSAEAHGSCNIWSVMNHHSISIKSHTDLIACVELERSVLGGHCADLGCQLSGNLRDS